MTRNHRTRLTLTLAAVMMAGFVTTASANAQATISISPTAPVVDGEDIALLTHPHGLYEEKFFTDTRAIGQTFTMGMENAMLDAITLRLGPNNTGPATKTYTIRVGEVSGTSFTEIASETATQSADMAAGDFMTFALDTPIELTADAEYGFDVAMNSSTTGWQAGIPYMESSDNNDSYLDGNAYRSEANGLGTPNFGFIRGDKIFHLNLASAAAAVPEPASLALWGMIGLALAGFGYYRARRKK